MATEASQPLKISLPVSAQLANALYTEWAASTIANGYAGAVPAQYTFVGINTAGQADLLLGAAGATGPYCPIGVIQNAPFVVSQTTSQVGGGMAEIVVIGVTKVRVNSAGLSLASTAVGTSIEAVVNTATLTGTAKSAGAFTGGSAPIVGQFLPQGSILTGASGDIARAVINCASFQAFIGN